MGITVCEMSVRLQKRPTVMLTIRETGEDPSQKPFTFLTEELRVVVCSTLSSGFELGFLDREQVLALRITERYVDMSVWIELIKSA